MGRRRKEPDLPRPEWASRIVETRVMAGYTQTTLAEAIPKSQSMVGAYETGKSEPDFATVQRIAHLCNVTPGWLIFGEGDPNESDPAWGPLFGRYKNHPCFAFAFTEGAKMLAEEGLKADFAYLIGHAAKLLAALEGRESDDGAEDYIRRSVETERLEIRNQMNEIRKKML